MPSSSVRLNASLVALFGSLALLLFLYHDSLPQAKDLSGLQIKTGDWKLLGHKTALEIDPPPSKQPFGAVVIAAGADTDLKWTMFAKAKCVLHNDFIYAS